MVFKKCYTFMIVMLLSVLTVSFLDAVTFYSLQESKRSQGKITGAKITFLLLISSLSMVERY